jgi:hypothetical protein
MTPFAILFDTPVFNDALTVNRVSDLFGRQRFVAEEDVVGPGLGGSSESERRRQRLHNFTADQHRFRRVAVNVRQIPGTTEQDADVAGIDKITFCVFAVGRFCLPSGDLWAFRGMAVFVRDWKWVQPDLPVIVKCFDINILGFDHSFLPLVRSVKPASGPHTYFFTFLLIHCSVGGRLLRTES